MSFPPDSIITFDAQILMRAAVDFVSREMLNSMEITAHEDVLTDMIAVRLIHRVLATKDETVVTDTVYLPKSKRAALLLTLLGYTLPLDSLPFDGWRAWFTRKIDWAPYPLHSTTYRVCPHLDTSAYKSHMRFIAPPEWQR